MVCLNNSECRYEDMIKKLSHKITAKILFLVQIVLKNTPQEVMHKVNNFMGSFAVVSSQKWTLSGKSVTYQ